MQILSWWDEFFDQEVAQLILRGLRPGELDFLVDQLGLKDGDRIFDQCCGWGRVAGPLARLGYHVEGVDSCTTLIQQGTKSWSGRRLKLVCADAHNYRSTHLFDAAVNLYSSFGYHPDETQHLQMLRQLSDSVRVGARIILDTINPDKVWGDFQPEMTQNWPTGYQLRRQSELVCEKRLLNQIWNFTRPNGECFERRGTTRLYTSTELQTLLNSAGLRTLRVVGDLQANPVTPQSERLILVAEKLPT